MAAPPITPTRAARHQHQGRPQGKERRQAPPSRSRLRRVLRWTLWLAVPAVAVALGTVIGLIYAFARVPLPAEVPTAQTIVFLDETGGHEIGTLSAQENRRVVPLKKIPEDTRRAVLAAEDRDFYEHGAISYRGLARAAAANLLRRRISEGGSTITQQYVKNAFPGVGRDRTLFRKLKEAVIAVKLERRHSKDQILEFYMNTVYFGRGAYGIDAAARTYFSVPKKKKVTVEDLTPAQSALLAGVIRSPEFYGKQEHAASAKARRDYILQVMIDRGWLSAKEGRAAIASRLGVSWKAKPQGIPNSRPPSSWRRCASTWSPATAPRRSTWAACGSGPPWTWRCRTWPTRRCGGSSTTPRPTPGRPWSRSTPATGPCGPCTAAGTSRPASSTTPPTPSARPARP
ncbi:MAG TPA: transglycosylase domain-containing protein [Actinomycetes bacterium]|nr:transglycosylase domain-containing protein [Actinomycetes bacterium]